MYSGRSKSSPKWQCHVCRCMLDYEPRKLTAQDCTVLCNLASMVIKQIQRDQLLQEKEDSGQVLQRRNSRLNVSSLYLHVHAVVLVSCYLFLGLVSCMLIGLLRSSIQPTSVVACSKPEPTQEILDFRYCLRQFQTCTKGSLHDQLACSRPYKPSWPVKSSIVVSRQ